MTTTRTALRIGVVTASLLCLGVSTWQSGTTVEARGEAASNDVSSLVGTWYLSVPLGEPGSGLTGFATYDHSGTLTQTVSNMFGGHPYPSGVTTLNGTDRGVWRRVPGGFEVLQFRMEFAPTTTEVSNIVRIRSLVRFDDDRNHLSGAFRVAIWFCPMPTTCPDPTSAAPDVPEFAPPENTFALSRVRFSP